MLKTNKQTLGKVTQSRTALMLFAAAALTGTASEASARSYRHHHHYAHHVARAEVVS
jgi:rare lipoprotein A